MPAWTIVLLEVTPLLCVAGVVGYFGYQAQKAQKELIARIRARYPKWIVTFNGDGTTTTHQVNSREEHAALEGTLHKS